MLEQKYISGKTAVNIARSIESAVAAGKIAVGEQLPSVRELSKHLGVAGATVSAAYRILQERGVTTVILVGWRANGGILYSSFGAAMHGYTVVVPVDGTSGGRSEQAAIGFYQMLDHVAGNPTNEPLKERAVTLTRIDLISFR